MTATTELLIVGAGPFGLSLSALAERRGIDHLIVGEPMSFWKDHMPAGMYLRSGLDWHLDPMNEHTLEHYLAEHRLEADQVLPISLDRYLDYAEWFRDKKGIEPLPLTVERLEQTGDGSGELRASLSDGSRITARHLVLAIGFRYFAYRPQELVALFPVEHCSHTCDAVDFSRLAGQRCLIVGGRQSAYEWAALLHEAGASEVHISHRHPAPAFTASDWSWVNALVDAMADDPGWYRRLTPQEQTELGQRFWTEGRLKLEPWLTARVNVDGVTAWPETQVVACEPGSARELSVRLSNGATLDVDHVILATGYKVDLTRVPMLSDGDLLPQIQTRNGFPALDEHFQTSVPGLYMTSIIATQDFGSFFAFTVSVRTSARVIARAIAG